MKKAPKRTVSLITTLSLLCALLAFARPNAGAVDDVLGTKQYTIGNPYETVNWDTWGSYKANLHTHSTVSDGDVDFRDMIEAYYSAGYDILAMTDHGTVNYGWDIKPDVDWMIGLANAGKTRHALTTARKLEICAGAGRNGRGMTEVPLGIELNGMSVKKTHINGFYANSGHHVRAMDETDYEPAVKAYHQAGGITHLNHIGDWAEAFGDPSVYDNAKVDYFFNIFNKYRSCLGFELVNTTDSRTKNDRILWDKLLQRVIPAGRNLFGFANDDSHELGDIGKSWEVFMMPTNTAANVRTAMETGTFFAVSRYARAELGDSFAGTGAAPAVTRIIVPGGKGQIKLQCQNYTKVQWVANGTVIAEGEEIDLNAYENAVGCYVRAQISGPGGMCFTQPFTVTSAPYADATVRFVKNPANAEVAVSNSYGSMFPPKADGSFVLPAGDYTYTAAAAGFITVTEPFAVTTADMSAGLKTIGFSLPAVPVLAAAAGSDTVVDRQFGYLYGLREGIASLDGFAVVNGSGSFAFTPTPNGFGTGTAVRVVHGEQVFETFTVVIKGDADGDGFANAADAAFISLFCGGMLAFSGAQEFAGDVNGDGRVDAIDADLIELAGLFLYGIGQT